LLYPRDIRLRFSIGKQLSALGRGPALVVTSACSKTEAIANLHGMIWLGEEAAITDIAMGGRPILEGKDELMTGSIERADTAIVLGPNDEVLEFDVRALGSPERLVDMAPSMKAKWSSKAFASWPAALHANRH
jgi:hypothetical protein